MNNNCKLPAYIFILLSIELAGCQSADKTSRNLNESPTPSINVTAAITKEGNHNTNLSVISKPARETQGFSHLVQCKRDLESLHRISPAAYERYRNEYDSLMRSSTSFIAVSGDLSDDISSLARPRFQFALVDLCYRIKNAVAQELLSQAGGEGGR